MSQMNLSLSLRSRLLMGTAVVDAYAVEGFKPNLVFDFDDEYYRTNSTVSTFDDSITHSATTNATMVDSDGVLKWRPHNLLTYSEDITNAAWSKSTGTSATDAETFDFSGDTTNGRLGALLSVAIGTKITFSFEMKAASSGTVTASLLYTNGTRVNLNCNLTAEWQTFSFTTVINNFIGAVYLVDCRAGAPTGGITAVNVRAIRCYRSDLGGMVDNPDRGNSYVPTTSAARYLPRRGHHVWNGSAWVNEGLLHESEARTNLLTYSEDFSQAYWVTVGVTKPSASISTPLGTSSGYEIVETADSSAHLLASAASTNVTSGTTYTGSFFLKKGDGSSAPDIVQLTFSTAGFGGTAYANFNLSTGTITVESGLSAEIEDYGSGWYRCSISQAASASVTIAQLTLVLVDNDPSATRVPSYTGDVSANMFVDGAQFEEGSTPSSYIPTSGSTVTRAAETLTIPAAKLPWPTPNVIGPELVTNGGPDFVDTSGWTAEPNGSVSVVGGNLRVSGTVAFDGAYTTISTVVGKVYKLDGSASLVSGSGVARMYVANSPSASAYSSLSPESGSPSIFTATATTTYLRAENSVANAVFDWDFVSVREIDPLSVSIQMDGRMTYADTGVTVEAIFHRWLLDGNNQIQARLNTSAGDGQVQFYSIAGGVVDSVDSDPDSYSPGINVPYNIASRHGSTFIAGAVGGVDIGDDLTPTALPDLSSTNLNLGYDYMGTIRTFRMWNQDITDAGIEAASVTAPLLFGLPTISGNTNQGATLTASSAPVVIGTPTPTTTWQWLRDGAPISGATSSTYVLTGDDVGSKVSVRQTVTNVGGTASATSAETATISAVPAGAIAQRDGAYILDRAGNYIEVRA